MTGPVTTEAFRSHLDSPPAHLPVGLGGVPVTALVNELLRRGRRVVVATASPDVDEDVLITGPRLRVHVGPYRPGGRARDAFRVERRSIRRALVRERPDVVHAHWTYEFALGALSSGLPTLVTIRDWAPTIFRFHRDGYRAVRLLMHVATLARGRHFSATSPYIVREAGRWRRSVDLVPNGLADQWFDDRPRRMRRDRQVLVSVNAGFGERKNSATLLRSFRMLRERRPTAELVLIGAGHQVGGPAHRWARSQGFETGVHFRGALSHTATMAAMADADVLVHPSLEESFGMTLVEAMAQGTPVIGGARSGAVPWVLDAGSAGMLTDVTSPTALTSAMDEMLSDEERWCGFSTQGFAHASSTFRLSKVVDRYLDIYTDMNPAL